MVQSGEFPGDSNLGRIERYHQLNDDSLGVTRYGVPGLPPLMSFYDGDDQFKVVVERDDAVHHVPLPDHIKHLSDAILRAQDY